MKNLKLKNLIFAIIMAGLFLFTGTGYAAHLDTQLIAAAPLNRSIEMPRMCTDGNGNFYVVWNVSLSDVYFNYSHDYGVTWQTENTVLWAAPSITRGSCTSG